jgi:hypothetical protein
LYIVTASFDISDISSVNKSNVPLKKKHGKPENVTENESTDENSNLVKTSRRKLKQKSGIKISNQKNPYASSHDKDHIKGACENFLCCPIQ